MSRAFLAVMLAACGLAGAHCSFASGVAEPRPNVVLILADDAGIETVGAYGGEHATPRIDELASQGVRFDNAHATPLCTPSRVRLLTGRYSFRNYKAFGHLGSGEPTLAKILGRAGYRPAVVGKWQLSGNPLDGVPGSTPRQAGFDEWAVWAADADFTQAGCQYWGATLETNGERRTYPGEFGPDVVHRYAIDFIERNAGRPFFLFYSAILPHDPWVATPRRLDVATPVQRFDAMVEHLDRQVGDLLDVLDRRELSRNTLVIFVADNGSHVSLRGRRHDVEVQGGKGSTLDAGTHVPLILRWPARLGSAGVSKDMVDLVDVFATIVAAADEQEELAASDGHDLVPRLRGGAAWPREAIFMDYALGWWPFDAVRYASTDRWKLYSDGRFFDTSTDPLEKLPLPASTSDQVRAAREQLEKVLAGIDYRPLTRADPHFPDGFDPEKIDYAAIGDRLMRMNKDCGDPARAPTK